MKKIEELAQTIQSKQDFILFLGSLIKDLRENPGDWENKKLNNYLEAMQSWIEDMDGYYINNNLPVPEDINWKVFSDILIAARIYE